MNDQSHTTAPLLGAYSMAPGDAEGQAAYYAGVAELDISGLEMPLPSEESPDLDPAVASVLQPHWDLVVTCIPTVMGRLAGNAGYGLASSDEEGRQQAISDVSRARQLAQDLAAEHGRCRVVAIEVHSAPNPERGSVDALARSLGEIVSWDLAGADVLVEHCDAFVPGQRAAKGFLTLPDEISAIQKVLGADQQDSVGVNINWGRSAIEGRSAATALEHVRAAAESGLLRALFFSGATDADTIWGDGWDDQHIPPRPTTPGGPLDVSSASLLGQHEITTAISAAGTSTRLGVKVSVRPPTADVATRLALLRAALELVTTAPRS